MQDEKVQDMQSVPFERLYYYYWVRKSSQNNYELSQILL